MPRGDGTGPWGTGAMTGQGAGFCQGFTTPGYTKNFSGGKFGHRRWGGRLGWRNTFYSTGAPRWLGFGPRYAEVDLDQEVQMLREQAQGLQSELDSIKERLLKIGNQAPVEK